VSARRFLGDLVSTSSDTAVYGRQGPDAALDVAGQREGS
jgi:hypothetical protein